MLNIKFKLDSSVPTLYNYRLHILVDHQKKLRKKEVQQPVASNLTLTCSTTHLVQLQKDQENVENKGTRGTEEEESRT